MFTLGKQNFKLTKNCPKEFKSWNKVMNKDIEVNFIYQLEWTTGSKHLIRHFSNCD